MTITSVNFYNAFISAGVGTDEAKAMSEEVAIKSELIDGLATKTDLKQQITEAKSEFYKAMLIQTGTLAGLITVINGAFLFLS